MKRTSEVYGDIIREAFEHIPLGRKGLVAEQTAFSFKERRDAPCDNLYSVAASTAQVVSRVRPAEHQRPKFRNCLFPRAQAKLPAWRHVRNVRGPHRQAPAGSPLNSQKDIRLHDYILLDSFLVRPVLRGCKRGG